MSDIELDELARRLGEVRILDVRQPYEYDGSHGNMCDPRQGHIPGAVNVNVHEMLEMTETQLRAAIDVPDGGEVVCYCHTGSRSAHAVTILQRLGYDARNYCGSWHEWSRTDQPVEQ